jgi:hypothetical protein
MWMETMRKPSQVAGVLAALMVIVGCGSSADRTLAPIPPLAGGGSGGAAAMPAIGFPSPGTIVYRVGGTLPLHHRIRRGAFSRTARLRVQLVPVGWLAKVLAERSVLYVGSVVSGCSTGGAAGRPFGYLFSTSST